jgi:hypothetical protein
MHGNFSHRALALTAALALTLTGTLAGCGKEEAKSTTKTVDPTVSADKKAPPAIANTWPLTGMTGDIVKRPALAVKIENSPEARPQTGLDDADMVWEEIVEGGISRYIAVFNSTLPETVGPVRSIRPMDGPIVGPTKGVIAFSGGQGRFITGAKDAGLVTLGQDQGAKGFFREAGRSAPHNTFARPEELLTQAGDNTAPPAPEFFFAAAGTPSSAGDIGSPATSIALTMSSGAHPTWTWDTGSSAWQRSEGDVAAVSSSGARLSATNVVAISVDVRNAGGTDAAGNAIPESIVVGSGSGLVASGGKTMDVKWSKESPTAPMVLKDPKGGDVVLEPGKTWVELVPSGDGSWTTS